jgi:MFS family permease
VASARISRRRIHLLGIALLSTAPIVCGAAPTTTLLDLARAVQGIGGAILMNNAPPILSQHLNGERRNMAISTWEGVRRAREPPRHARHPVRAPPQQTPRAMAECSLC